MSQDTANTCLVIISIITLIVVAWYTYETRKMQIAVTRQSEEFIRQIRLSIMPAFVSEVIFNSGPSFKLKNVGNGSAINIRISDISFPWPDDIKEYDPNIHIKFSKVLCLLVNDETIVDHKVYFAGEEKDYLNLARLDEKRAKGKEFEINLSFQDIEGTNYVQKIVMGEGGTRPGPVLILNL